MGTLVSGWNILNPYIYKSMVLAIIAIFKTFNSPNIILMFLGNIVFFKIQ